MTNATEIRIEAHGGTVQLGGWVDSDETRTAATRVTRAIQGATAVDNRPGIEM
jgi:osmotically-inducible protein OsmY